MMLHPNLVEGKPPLPPLWVFLCNPVPMGSANKGA
jgi:hypothetical protein